MIVAAIDWKKASDNSGIPRMVVAAARKTGRKREVEAVTMPLSDRVDRRLGEVDLFDQHDAVLDQHPRERQTPEAR